jgi:serine/threonine protein kinase
MITLPPTVIDFGISRRLRADGTTEGGEGQSVPTRYMPPEVHLGGDSKIGLATDLYQLGVLGLELLTGQNPFRGIKVRSPRLPCKV